MNLERLLATLKVEEGTGPVKNGRFFPYRDSRGVRRLDEAGSPEASGVR